MVPTPTASTNLAMSLKQELGVSAPACIDTLSPDQQSQLLALVKGARQKQETDLKAALDGALDMVPMLLRGPIKKIFFG
jgi:hypothetical protein